MLPALAPPYGELRPTFWEQYGATVIVGVLIVAVLAGLAGWLILRPKPPVHVPPEVAARESLAKLLRQPESGTVLSEISGTLRRYIVAAFSLPSGEWTTGEFALVLANTRTLDDKLALSVSNLLRECDQRKFSPHDPGIPLNAASRALEMVSEIEKQRANSVKLSSDERRI